MAGDQDEKPDPERDYNEGKLKMKTDKTMTKKLKRLDNAIADFVELQQMDIPKEDLVGAPRQLTIRLKQPTRFLRRGWWS